MSLEFSLGTFYGTVDRDGNVIQSSSELTPSQLPIRLEIDSVIEIFEALSDNPGDWHLSMEDDAEPEHKKI